MVTEKNGGVEATMRSLPTGKWFRFPVPEMVPATPHLLYAGWDAVSSPAYRWDGAERQRTPRCVFQYTLEGYGCLDYEGRTYVVDSGKAFIYDLSTPNSCYYYPPGETTTWRFVYCVFVNFEEAVRQLAACHGPVYDFGVSCPVVERLLSLLNARENRPSDADIFDGYEICTQILGDMVRLAQGHENSACSPLAARACELIRRSRLEPFSLRDLASRLGVCPEHLCREFRKSLNTSPKQYHEVLRVDAIRERLIRGDPIKAVADDFGFPDTSNFTKFFRKHCGFTPGTFRRYSTTPPHDVLDNPSR